MNDPLSVDSLKKENIDIVIVAAADMQGRLFGRRVPTTSFLELASQGLNIPSCALGWDISQSIGLQVEYTGFHTGWHDFRLVPDLSTLRPLAWLNRTAFVFADIVDIQTSNDLAIAPRAILRRQIKGLSVLKYYPKVATELEFFLFKNSYDEARSSGYRNLVPTTTVRSQDLINRETNSLEPFFEKLRSALIGSGIDVAFSESEWGYGQWEVNLFHHNPMEIAARHLLFKLATRDIASHFGLSATFMAKPKPDDIGSSCHIHCSLEDANGHNLFYEPKEPSALSHLMRHAIGGLLDHILELMIWYAPTVNSYRRTSSNQFAGHGNTWGFDNRTTSCRISGDSEKTLRFEFRVPGADVNPYLALSALLASVHDGISSIREIGQPYHGNAYQAENIEKLPATLEEASNLFDGSEFAVVSFGKEVVRHYSAHARYEAAQFRAAVTDWEKERYFESI